MAPRSLACVDRVVRASHARMALLGPLPWIAEGFAAEDYAAHHSADSDTRSLLATHHHHGDAADIPGSPTHPDDHNCFQCQVLKQLARCVPTQLDPPTIPLQSGCPVQPRAHAESQHAGHVAFLPPVRGPPLRNA